MLSRIRTASLWGVDAFEIQVEVDASGAMPGFILVGLGDNAIKESRERLLASLKNQGFQGIQRKIIINLAPADRRKEGSALDLAMAMGILISTEQFCPKEELNDWLLFGELSLDGSLMPVRGALSLLLFAKSQGVRKIIFPSANREELSIDLGIEVHLAENLREACQILEGETHFQCEIKEQRTVPCSELDFAEVKGQEGLKRALEIAAAGGHNFLLIGSPGSGKTMCARRLPSILPPLSLEESLETTRIHSVAGLIHKGQGLLSERPFRSPHHTVSPSSLVGGGSWPRPGECSLSHHGVLFLDELPEYPRIALETLRQPLEDGFVTIARTAHTISFPSRFILGAAMNPCPCGFLGDPLTPCTCHPGEISRYLSKISGPLLDRIDLQVAVPNLSPEVLRNSPPSENSGSIRERVLRARNIQAQRLKLNPGLHCNAHLHGSLLAKFCSLSGEAEDFFLLAMRKWNLSARAHDRVLKVARTIADLEQKEHIELPHLAEALQYRIQATTGINPAESQEKNKNLSRPLVIGGQSILQWRSSCERLRSNHV